MRTVLSVWEGGESHSLRSKVGIMRKLLWLKRNIGEDVHTDRKPGVWLRSFQSIDLDGPHEDPVQEWGEEEDDGAVFGITLRREPVVPSPDTPDQSTTFTFTQYHTVKLRRLKVAPLERLVAHLLDSEHQEQDFTRVFLSTYRAFTSTNTLIELLFQRAECVANSDNAVCARSGLSSVIRLWLQEYSEDFQEPPQYQSLRFLCACLRRRVSFRRLVHTGENLLQRFQEQDCSQLSSEPSPGSLVQAQQDLEEVFSLGTDKSIMDFPVREVAEQLTRLDAELFVKVKPFHCLGCVWSQRDKKENGNLAPTVRATISQFNAVTNCVITSLLCPSTSPFSTISSTLLCPPSAGTSSPRCSHTNLAHRARIIEQWIAIAQECRELKNFSSLRAVLSALQSNAVYRLKKTWAAVSRDSMASFEHLCETFPDENCVLRNREILVEDGSATPGSNLPQLCSRQMMLSSGVVPYLGTYLSILTMLDAALNDTVEEKLINFEKRRREYEILSQIQQLQASCSHYSLPVNTEVTSWLQTRTLLTDQKSYELSHKLEPPVDSCPSSPCSWSSRLRIKKMTILQPGSDSSPRKTHADQISVSSSSSGSSDMEDLSAPQPLPLRIKSLSGSLHNVAEAFSTSSSPSPSLSNLSCSSSHPDLSSTSLGLSPEPLTSASSSQTPLPVYNKQVADICIIRVSVECVSNGNVYKSILLTNQDHTPQVIQRALDKHNMEDLSYNDFGLYQMLSHGKALHIPDKANVFYAMCTTDNYDFLLRQRWRNHGKHFGTSLNPAFQPKSRFGK